MLKHRAHAFLAFVTLLFAAAAAHGQYYKLHQADIAVGGIGQFTKPITDGNGNNQYTHDSPGVLLSLRDHPVPWAGIEFNYGYSRYGQVYSSVAGYKANIKSNTHEATAAYMFHPHFRRLQPFVNVGGGALDFIPIGPGSNQWRWAGLAEVGFDLPTSNPHFGFRVQGRGLAYRAPNFFNSNISSQKWVVTSEPSVSAYVRF